MNTYGKSNRENTVFRCMRHCGSDLYSSVAGSLGRIVKRIVRRGAAVGMDASIGLLCEVVIKSQQYLGGRCSRAGMRARSWKMGITRTLARSTAREMFRIPFWIYWRWKS